MARSKIYDWFFYDSDNTLFAPNSDGYEMLGYGGDDAIHGGGGDDVIKGGDGHDTLFGGNGDDTITGGDGHDHFYIDRGNNVYDGGSGSDLFDFSKVFIYTSNSPLGSVSQASVSNFTIGFSVDLWSGETRSQSQNANATSVNYSDLWGTNTFSNFQFYWMGQGDDILRGNNAGHEMWGWDGNDTLEGRGGADFLNGGEGIDTASYEGSDGFVIVNLDTGEGSFNDAEGDTLYLIENLIGSRFNDHLVGDNGDNKLEGRDGADVLAGYAGRDTLIGGESNDTLNGGLDKDVMTGGNGEDVFKFNRTLDSTTTARDKITDFNGVFDHIDLTAIDADTSTKADDAFNFIGSAAFSGDAGELRFSTFRTATGGIDYRVEGDVNGDGAADFAFEVHTVTIGDLAANDFFL